MKNHCLILLLALVSIAVHAQTSEQTVAYFDKKYDRIPDAEGAAYRRTVVPSGDIFVVRDYAIASGKVSFEAECTEYIPRLIIHGKKKNYFASGILYEESTYKNGERYGEVITYFENGKPQNRIEYLDNKTLYRQIYTEDGKELLVNGRGVLTDTGDKGETIYTLLKNYEYFSCYTLAGKDTTFLILSQVAEYPGGTAKLNEDIGKAIKYPTDARKAGIEGKVVVEFIINKAGEVEDAHVVTGIGGSCDEEAVRVISGLKKWKPGIHRGKLVKSRFKLPLMFGLSG